VRVSRRRRPDVEVASRERLLAWAALSAESGGGWVAGTRDALYLPGRRVPWEQVQAADWDPETDRLRISEVGSWGEARPRHVLAMAEAGTSDADRLLQLIRERVTASVLIQRHVAVTGRRGVRVVARRAPSGRSEPTWLYEYDDGIDPDDPFVRAAAETALAGAKADVGML
jgi:hypothetical protein